jgi:transposase
MSLVEVCKITGIDWKTAKDIDIWYTMRQIESLRNLTPIRIGIDEIASEKGYKYLTIVRDLDIGRVIWIGSGRKRETLDGFFSEIGPEKTAMIKVVVLDMWDPYIFSVEANCPNADIVFDKFHVIKLVNEALDKPNSLKRGMKNARI